MPKWKDKLKKETKRALTNAKEETKRVVSDVREIASDLDAQGVISEVKEEIKGIEPTVRHAIREGARSEAAPENSAAPEVPVLTEPPSQPLQEQLVELQAQIAQQQAQLQFLLEQQAQIRTQPGQPQPSALAEHPAETHLILRIRGNAAAVDGATGSLVTRC